TSGPSQGVPVTHLATPCRLPQQSQSPCRTLWSFPALPSCVGYTSTGPRITPGLVQFEQLLVVAGHTSPRSTSCLLGRYPVPRPCRLRPKELSGREPRRVNCTSLLARGGALRTERSNNELVR